MILKRKARELLRAGASGKKVPHYTVMFQEHDGYVARRHRKRWSGKGPLAMEGAVVVRYCVRALALPLV